MLAAWHGWLDRFFLHAELAPFITFAMVLLLGVTAQVLAYRLALPGIIFLLAGGVLFGPNGLGLIRPEVFGGGLRSLVALCVAIIVFEGALMIDLHHLRRASRAVLGLISVGIATTTLLAALLTWRLLGVSPEVALLFGAIVSVTGPTVIAPILARVPITPRLQATLEGEAIFADAVGVVVAAGVFNAITVAGARPASWAWQTAQNLLLGGAIGAAVAWVAYALLKRLSPLPGPMVRLGVLGAALLAYLLAELAAHETGIMAVAIAGVVLGSLPLPYAGTVRKLERDLTVMALSLVFVLLAANLPLQGLLSLGWPAVALVLLLMLVVRPITVAVSTWGAALSWREKAFAALLAPRGIVAASAATFFSYELTARSVPGADRLTELVFLVIIVTVVVEGSAAPWLASWLRVVPPKVFIFGGDKTARLLAEQQMAEGQTVQLLEEDIEKVHTLMERDLPVEHCRLANVRRVTRLGGQQAHSLVIATEDDARNYQLARLMKRHFPRTRIFVRLNTGTDAEPFRQLGVELWPQSEEKPTALPLSVWNAAVMPEAVREARVANAQMWDRPLAELGLPAGAVVMGVRRDGRMFVPRGHSRLHRGDEVILAGDSPAVEAAARMLIRG